MTRVKEIMDQTVSLCRTAASLNDAAQTMWEHNCGLLPVVSEQGSVVGVVTDRDICMAAYTQGRSLADLPVEIAMARRVLSCRGDEDIDVAEKRMLDAQVNRLPVLDEEEKPIGLISLNAIVRTTIGPQSVEDRLRLPTRHELLHPSPERTH